MNALTILKQDHNNVDALFTRFEKATAADEKREIVDKIIEQLSVHAAVEEQVFYPAVREAVDEAESDVLEGLEEHHVAKWTLSELEKLKATDERFDAKVTVLIESVRHHVEEEENDMFSKVRDAMTAEQLEALGEAIEKAKETAPRRPHPRTPDTPPLNVLVGTPVALLDRAFQTGRDTLTRVLGSK